MKTVFLFISLLLSMATTATAQISYCKELLGMTDNEVQTYMDSLNTLKSNPYYKTQREVNGQGDLILKCSFAISDEEFYKCRDIMAVFMRIKGVEYCAMQIVLGAPKYAYYNLSHIKDTYKFISENRWEYLFPDSKDA